MLDGLRDQVVALACRNRGLDPHHGRDADALPTEVTAALATSRAESLVEPGLAGRPRVESLRATLDLLAE